MTEFIFNEPDLRDEDLRLIRDQVRRYVNETIVPSRLAQDVPGALLGPPRHRRLTREGRSASRAARTAWISLSSA